jgi:hypothetical protein
MESLKWLFILISKLTPSLVAKSNFLLNNKLFIHSRCLLKPVYDTAIKVRFNLLLFKNRINPALYYILASFCLMVIRHLK